MAGLQRSTPLKRSGGLKRGAPLKRGDSLLRRTPFKAAAPVVRPVKARSISLPAPVPEHLRSRAVISQVGEEVRADPKSVELRCPQLLAMANRRPCLLRIPGICNGDPETTVACHSNQSKHGKAGARKADDHYSVWGCYACHTWLDTESIEYEVKVVAFDRTMLIQLEEWIIVANDPKESETNRRAARWALFQHGVPV